MMLCAGLVCSVSIFGQSGRATNGYYPPNYNGDTFSGKVTAVNEKTEEITISFEQGGKSERFVGLLQRPCAVPSKDGQGMSALDLPVGSDITAFFIASGQEKPNSIIGIMFHSWNGHPVKPAARKMYLCSSTPIVHYWRCFNTSGVTCLEPPGQF